MSTIKGLDNGPGLVFIWVLRWISCMTRLSTLNLGNDGTIIVYEGHAGLATVLQ